jgi:hypothetical protein
MKKTSASEIRLLTNHLELAATTIGAIYKERWQIELFFKTLKQNVKIKTFVGTSPNAVNTQIWTALIAILLVSLKKFLHFLGRSIPAARSVFGTRIIRSSISAEGVQISLTTSFGSLSSRKPRKPGALILPSEVHSWNATSQTSLGFTHWTGALAFAFTCLGELPPEGVGRRDQRDQCKN